MNDQERSRLIKQWLEYLHSDGQDGRTRPSEDHNFEKWLEKMTLKIRETKGLPLECSFAVDHGPVTIGLFPTKEYAELFKVALENSSYLFHRLP